MLFSEMESIVIKLKLDVSGLKRDFKELEAAVNEIQMANAKPEKKSRKAKAKNVVAMPKRF